jgi:hypothetical protein
MAQTSMLSSESQAALVGGTNLMLSSMTAIAISQLQALSPAGRCQTFEASADGYGRSEGIAVLLLDQLRSTGESEPLFALLRGTAVNQAGQSGGLTAPSGPAQSRVVLRALQQGTIDPSTLHSVAVHGTGTALGDPIEVGALAQVLGATQAAVLASVKSCYGHAEGSSGLAGVLMAVCSASHRSVAPVANLRAVNAYVQAAGEGMQMPREAASLPCLQETWNVGTSSFGMSGVNAHAILGSVQIVAGDSQVRQWMAAPQRVWPMPTVHPILDRALAVSSTVAFSCNLTQAALAYLRQHARHSLPTGALLEMMVGARRTMGGTRTSSHVPALSSAVFVSSVPGGTAWLDCTTQLRGGSAGIVEVAFRSGSGVQGLSIKAATATMQIARCRMPRVQHPVGSTLGVTGVLQSALRMHMDGYTAISCCQLPPGLPDEGYNCHPAMAEAFMSSTLLCTLGGSRQFESLRPTGCQAFVTAGAPGLIFAVSSQGTMDAGTHALRGLYFSGLGVSGSSQDSGKSYAEEAGVTDHMPPIWELVWKPVSYPGLVQPAAPCLLLSCEPWPLSAICSPPANGARPPMVSVNAVWDATVTTGAELCLSSDAHLHMILRAAGGAFSILVSPPGGAHRGADKDGSVLSVAAALACLRAVATGEGPAGPFMGLITYDLQQVDQAWAAPSPGDGLLQGKAAPKASPGSEWCIAWRVDHTRVDHTTDLSPVVMLSGMFRSLFMEHRSRYTACIDLPSSHKIRSEQLAPILSHSAAKFGVAVRGDQTYSLRLRPAPHARHRGSSIWAAQTLEITSALVTGGSKVQRALHARLHSFSGMAKLAEYTCVPMPSCRDWGSSTVATWLRGDHARS